MDHDAARIAGKPGRRSGLAVDRQSPASIEPLLKAALDTALPGLILLDTARRARHVTPMAASLLGLPPDGHGGTQDPPPALAQLLAG